MNASPRRRSSAGESVPADVSPKSGKAPTGPVPGRRRRARTQSVRPGYRGRRRGKKTAFEAPGKSSGNLRRAIGRPRAPRPAAPLSRGSGSTLRCRGSPRRKSRRNSVSCRRAAATIAASAKLNRALCLVRKTSNACWKSSEQGRKSTSSAFNSVSATSRAIVCPHLASSTVTTSRNMYSSSRRRPKTPPTRSCMAWAAAP